MSIYDQRIDDLSPAEFEKFNFSKECLIKLDKYKDLIEEKGYYKRSAVSEKSTVSEKSAVSKKSSTNPVLIFIILIIGILIYHLFICKK